LLIARHPLEDLSYLADGPARDDAGKRTDLFDGGQIYERQAAGHDYALSVQVPELPQAAQHFSVSCTLHGARVEDYGVGFDRVWNHLVPGDRELTQHELGVTPVRGAAVGLAVDAHLVTITVMEKQTNNTIKGKIENDV